LAADTSNSTQLPYERSRRRAAWRRRRRHTALAIVATVGVAACGLLSAVGLSADAAAPPGFPRYRTITFPVLEHVTYTDTFGAPRSGGRHHEGEDLIGKRLFHEVSAVDGTVVYMRSDAGGLGGNWLEIRDADGWYYNYGHINNDDPGTDDGANPRRWRFAWNLHVGSKVKAGQFVAYMGNSGDAEHSVPHLHFEIRTPSRVAIDEYPSLRLAQHLSVDNTWCNVPSDPTGVPSANSGRGYWLVDGHGSVQAFGAAVRYGDASALPLAAPVLGIRATPTGRGYRLVARDGGVFSYGDAHFYGSTGRMRLFAPVQGLVPTPTGAGYWLFARDGGIFRFGDAHFAGSAFGALGGAHAVAMASTASGRGYWIVGSDGVIHNFGDAAPLALSVPIHNVVAMAVTRSGNGAWLLTAGGDVAVAGTARYEGMPMRSGYCTGVGSAGIIASATGAGYWVAQRDGLVMNFGDAKDYGSSGGTAPIVGIDRM
jgi:murein DD-endopeptidase MepM/ murein hydrolase activator NlpD